MSRTSIVSLVAILTIVGGQVSPVATQTPTTSFDGNADRAAASRRIAFLPMLGFDSMSVATTSRAGVGASDAQWVSLAPTPIGEAIALPPSSPSVVSSAGSATAFGAVAAAAAKARAHTHTSRHEPQLKPKPAAPRYTAVGAWHMAPSASWYGPDFYGHQTACGQRYTRRIVGVASRTLPCGTLVQLHWHGITVVAPVIDRGPYGAATNIFDLSHALACRLLRPSSNSNGCFTRYDVAWRIVRRD